MRRQISAAARRAARRIRRATHPAQRGSAAAGFLVVVLVMVVGCLLGIGLGKTHLARTQAQGAADLAGLAADYEQQQQLFASARARWRDPCQLAREVAAANGARLVQCMRSAGGIYEVQTAVAHPWGIGQAKARAKAGPG